MSSSSSLSIDAQDANEAVASRKQAAAEMRRARKAARDPRNRLLSDSSSGELPKGILKNSHIPTKRSASECVDDLSQIMADLDLNIHDLPNTSARFCPRHHLFQEEEEDEDEEADHDCEEYEHDGEEDEHDGSEDEDSDGELDEADGHEHDHEHDHKKKLSGIRARSKSDSSAELQREYCREFIADENEAGDSTLRNGEKKGNRTICDCNLKYGDRNGDEKPKKSVRFNEHVYEAVFFAARLYDRRNFAKYHFSSRHHPSVNKQGKTKKNKQQSSSKVSKGNNTEENAGHKSENGCKQTKSQRAKQSKKDRKKRLNKKEHVVFDTNNDDQGYCSAFHSLSD